MSRRPRRGTRSRRSCCLAFSGVTVFLLILAAGGFAWLYKHPMSNEALHERVLRRLERISGLSVAYDSASLTLATGQYQIRNLRFMDPAKDAAPILTIDEVLATIRPWQLISNPESVLTKVVLKNPSQLDLLYSQRSIQLGERARFLAESVNKAQPPESGRRGRLPFEELKIENAEVAFVEKEGILPDIAAPKPAMIMEGQLIIKNEASGKLAFEFEGNAARPADAGSEPTTSTMASGVEAVIHLDSNNSMKIEGQAERIALSRIFREAPETAIRAAGLKINLDTGRTSAIQTLNGVVQAANISYVSPENSVQLTDEALNLAVNLDYDTSSTLLNVTDLKLNSAGAQATMRGQTEFLGKKPYAFAVHAQQVKKDYRVLMERLLPAGWDVQASRDSLTVDMVVGGNASGVTSLDGKLAVRGVDLVTPALPAALKNLHGDVQIDSQQVRFVDMTGEYAGARVALDGSFKGDPWKAKSGELDLNWSTLVPLEEVLSLHGNNIAATGLAGSGNLRGTGSWRQQINLADSSASGTPLVEGQVQFENVGLQYAALPAPIAGLNGTTRIQGNQLQVENLSGKMRGNELEISGLIAGRDFFWRDAQVSASLKSKMDLAQIGPYLSAEQQKNLAEYQLKGLAETEIVIKGPANDIGSRFTGAVQVSGVSFAPGLDFMEGTFSDVAGTLRWDGRTMRLEELTGLLNGEEVALGGTISSSHIDLNIQAEPQLEVVEKTFPQMNKYLDMTGGLMADLRWSAGTPEDAPASGSITQMLEAARALADNSIRDKTFSLNGDLEFKDADVRHIAMPPARKENGRSIPEGRLRGLTGRVIVANDTLTVPDGATMSCAFADTPNCRLSGSIKLRPDNFPELNVRVSSAGLMKIDTWAMGWGKDLHKPDKPPITNKKFDLTAELIAPSVEFRGQQGGRSRAKLTFNMTQDDSPRITNFREVVIQGNRPGMGRIIGSGRIESFVWDEQRFPRWQASLDAQSMPLENMLTAVFITPSNMRGMYTGNLDVQGVGKNSHSIRGQGSGLMTNLEIGGTGVIRELGATTGRNFGGMLFQTARAATFEIGNGALSSRDLALETNGLMLEMRGDYYFAGDASRGIPPRTIDGALRLRLFKSVFGSIPIIGQVADLADEVTNAFLLAFRVTGNASDPRVTPVALPVFQGGA